MEELFSSVQRKMLYSQIKELKFFDTLIAEGNLLKFLSAIWDIDALPSTDMRFNTLRADIQQHMINNDDWEYDYLFSEILNIYKDDEIFIKFVQEAVNPCYHSRDSQLIMVDTINEYLLPKQFILKPNSVDENGLNIYKISEHSSIYDDSTIPENNIIFYLERNPSGRADMRSSHTKPSHFPAFVMVVDRWDDYGVESRFELFYYESQNNFTHIGAIKIINSSTEYTGIRKYKVRNFMEDEFYYLAENDFCSLGQSQDYYDNIKSIFPQKYMSILWALKDCSIFSFIEDNFERHQFFYSLIRDNSVERLLRQEKYIIEGRKISSCENFSYEFQPKYSDSPINIEFSFDIHNIFAQRVFAIIGQNGVGKTQLITSLPIDLANQKEASFAPQVPLYSKIIAVSNSLYDSFDIPKSRLGFNYVYCGLSKGRKEKKTILDPKELKLQLTDAARIINGRERAESLKNILKPLYQDTIIQKIFTSQKNKVHIDIQSLVEIIDYISSGESSLLFIFFNIVKNIRYDSLLLFDEPEIHLHPNAITSLMSSIYQLLDDYQSYAILVTHSPLVIREMRSCGVRVMERNNDFPTVRYINMESLGANISSLLEDIFENKDIPKYYKIKIEQLIKSGKSYEEMISALQPDDLELGIGIKMYIKQLYESVNEEN